MIGDEAVAAAYEEFGVAAALAFRGRETAAEVVVILQYERPEETVFRGAAAVGPSAAAISAGAAAAATVLRGDLSALSVAAGFAGVGDAEGGRLIVGGLSYDIGRPEATGDGEIRLPLRFSGAAV